MHRRSTFVSRQIMLMCCLATGLSAANSLALAGETSRQIQGLIAAGAYGDAEKLLRVQIPDADAPITGEAAIQLEVLRRTRQDFRLSAADVLAEIKESIPDATMADVERWRDAGVLQHRAIDGEERYFREAVGNLFRVSEDARSRRTVKPKPRKEFDTAAHIRELLRLAADSDGAEVFPVRHHVTFEVIVNENHPRLKPGAKVRAWLPFPQAYRQQRDVKLVASEPTGAVVAPEDAPQRTIYFEQIVGDSSRPPRFRADFEFTTSAYVPKLDLALAKPYDTADPFYREYTAERSPHIVFTPEVKRIAAEAVGDATNPLERAQRVYRWVASHLPWCSEMEYSIIPNISAKGLAARTGDCGVQGLTFITLCRAAGVPARWQSGWQTKQPNWNMHDWSEFYVEPWGWLPADASYGSGLHANDDPQVRDFFCGHMDPYRLIVNLDYGRELVPPKTSFRSEPVDFQRGEVEIDGHNLYFDEWGYKFNVESKPLGK
jgi:transglutaminase-like putative cysteine protease